MNHQQAHNLGVKVTRQNPNATGYPMQIKTSAEKDAFDKGRRDELERQRKQAN